MNHKGKFYWLKFFVFHAKSTTVTHNEEFQSLQWHDVAWESAVTTKEEMQCWNWHLSWIVSELRTAPSMSWNVHKLTEPTVQRPLSDSVALTTPAAEVACGRPCMEDGGQHIGGPRAHVSSHSFAPEPLKDVAHDFEPVTQQYINVQDS